MQRDVDEMATDSCHTPRRAQGALTNVPDHLSPVTDTMSPEQNTRALTPIAGAHTRQEAAALRCGHPRSIAQIEIQSRGWLWTSGARVKLRARVSRDCDMLKKACSPGPGSPPTGSQTARLKPKNSQGNTCARVRRGRGKPLACRHTTCTRKTSASPTSGAITHSLSFFYTLAFTSRNRRPKEGKEMPPGRGPHTGSKLAGYRGAPGCSSAPGHCDPLRGYASPAANWPGSQLPTSKSSCLPFWITLEPKWQPAASLE